MIRFQRDQHEKFKVNWLQLLFYVETLPGVRDVNAFYESDWNKIFLTTGILQPPFFSMHLTSSMNYGAIGSIIGENLIIDILMRFVSQKSIKIKNSGFYPLYGHHHPLCGRFIDREKDHTKDGGQ